MKTIVRLVLLGLVLLVAAIGVFRHAARKTLPQYAAETDEG